MQYEHKVYEFCLNSLSHCLSASCGTSPTVPTI